MKMFVFEFGNGGWDQQHAVVLAESLEEARVLLLVDMAEQRDGAERWPHDPSTINPNWKGREGYEPYNHTMARIDSATLAGHAPRAVGGQVVYLIGVDG